MPPTKREVLSSRLRCLSPKSFGTVPVAKKVGYVVRSGHRVWIGSSMACTFDLQNSRPTRSSHLAWNGLGAGSLAWDLGAMPHHALTESLNLCHNSVSGAALQLRWQLSPEECHHFGTRSNCCRSAQTVERHALLQLAWCTLNWCQFSCLI